MKRMTAIALALLTLLMGAAACAESTAAKLELEHIKLSALGGESEGVVKLYDMGLAVAVGNAGGAPTLQATLYYGDGQQLESAIQVVGSRLLLSLGGISGTYSVDLAAFMDDEAKSALTAGALGSALILFGANPQLAMDMTMPMDKKGVRRLVVMIPRETYVDVAEHAMGTLARFGFATEEDIASMRQTLDESTEPIRLSIRYNTGNTKLRIRLIRGGKGIQLNARMKVTSEPMELIDPSADPLKRDLLGMDADAQAELRDELDFLAMKYDFFAQHTRLIELIG